MDYFTCLSDLRKRLAALDRRQWPLIAESLGITRNLPAKIVNEPDREFRPSSIAPLLEFFASVDAGQRQLPAVPAARASRRRASATAAAGDGDKRSGAERRVTQRPIAFADKRKAARRAGERVQP